VVRPVDADVVNLVLAIAQLHDAVDDSPGVGGQRSFRRAIRRGSADDRSRPLTVVRAPRVRFMGRLDAGGTRFQ
jgi:hypothetical protein